LNLEPDGGITGIPTGTITTATTSSFTVRLTNTTTPNMINHTPHIQQAFTITVHPLPVIEEVGAFSDGMVLIPYRFDNRIDIRIPDDVPVNGWIWRSNNLPPGLSIVPMAPIISDPNLLRVEVVGAATGPDTAREFTISLTAETTGNPNINGAVITTDPIPITIWARPRFVTLANSLNEGMDSRLAPPEPADEEYTTQIRATDFPEIDTLNWRWDFETANLPPLLTAQMTPGNQEEAVIRGFPTIPGRYSFNITLVAVEDTTGSDGVVMYPNINGTEISTEDPPYEEPYEIIIWPRTYLHIAVVTEGMQGMVSQVFRAGTPGTKENVSWDEWNAWDSHGRY
jgi:hypothetical protein